MNRDRSMISVGASERRSQHYPRPVAPVHLYIFERENPVPVTDRDVLFEMWSLLRVFIPPTLLPEAAGTPLSSRTWVHYRNFFS